MRKFEKVSFEQFKKDFYNVFPDYPMGDVGIETIYNGTKLPERKTKKSAGYDIHMPFLYNLDPNEDVLIPTGIKASMDDDDVMLIFPRSSLGFKYYIRLANSTGVGDSDYYDNPDNEGHYFVKIRNEGSKPVTLFSGDAIAQAIFIKYGVTVDDKAEAERVGGIGSTNR